MRNSVSGLLPGNWHALNPLLFVFWFFVETYQDPAATTAHGIAPRRRINENVIFDGSSFLPLQLRRSPSTIL